MDLYQCCKYKSFVIKEKQFFLCQNYSVVNYRTVTISSNDHWLTLTFYGKVKFTFRSSIWEEFMELVKDFGAS